MWKTTEGSSERLFQLCIGYFLSYVATGVLVKYFTGMASDGLPGMSQIEYLVYSTIGGNAICLVVVLLLRWYKMQSASYVKILGLSLPREIYYLVPSGICTAVVIPTTTLMYTLPISVMVAMIIMRASIIIVGRLIDEVQIRQGILKKTVYKEENIAVAFALIAASVQIFWVKKGDFDFVHSFAAMAILTSYLIAYTIRLYIMNYFKNTRPKGVPQDNKGYFALEQIIASITMVGTGYLLFKTPEWFNWNPPQIQEYVRSFSLPHLSCCWATLGGTVFGIAAFFSVFIFMFKGRTATFAGLANRLTSLVAGTTATIISYFMFGGKFPKMADWIALVFIFIAVHFLTIAEKKRTAELVSAHEITKA